MSHGGVKDRALGIRLGGSGSVSTSVISMGPSYVSVSVTVETMTWREVELCISHQICFECLLCPRDDQLYLNNDCVDQNHLAYTVSSKCSFRFCNQR
jgi:hypothetical protein